jgi:SAM-dependent methyltransferase
VVGSSPDPAAYGRAFADVYDDWYSDVSDTASTIEALATLARGGRVLELGVGTGRLAIPLSERCDVHGVDASTAMLDLLAAKPEAKRVKATLGDMAGPLPGGPYDLVFVAFNTFFNLADNESQQACVRHVAEVLAPGGHFVVETIVAPLAQGTRAQHGESRRPDGSGGSIRTITTHEPGTQTIHGVHIHTSAEGRSVDRPWRLRYLHPSQLDDLCAAEGLALGERWADWDATPWTADDHQHVSVYTAR